MKKHFLLFFTGVALLASCTNSTTTETTEVKKDNTTAPKEEMAKAKPDSATSMKNWMEYMTPGAMHQMMAAWSGTWDGEVSMWHTPDAPPEMAKLTTTNKMILGGRYQSSTHIGSMMGQPFEGMATMGYDNAKKMFISSWVDNMGTGIMVLEGKWDEATKTITSTGKCVAAEMGDGSEMGVKETFKVVDNDHQVMEMFMVEPDGKETKTMEIKFTRKK